MTIELTPEIPPPQHRRGRRKLAIDDLTKPRRKKLPRPSKALLLVTRAQLDRRSLAARAYDQRIAKIFHDLAGGRHGALLPEVTRATAHAFVATSIILDALTVKMLNGKPVNETSYRSLLNSLTKMATTLGMKPPSAKPAKTAEPAVGSLQAYLASKAAADEVTSSGAAHRDAPEAGSHGATPLDDDEVDP